MNLYPRTLNELRKFSRGFGRAAARDAEWSCITAWLMNGPPDAALSNPADLVRTVVLMVRDYDRFRFEYPQHDGEEPIPPPLYMLSPDVRQQALRVAAATLSDWRRAGRPHLEPHRIKSSFQHLISCPGFIDRYIKERQ